MGPVRWLTGRVRGWGGARVGGSQPPSPRAACRYGACLGGGRETGRSFARRVQKCPRADPPLGRAYAPCGSAHYEAGERLEGHGH